VAAGTLAGCGGGSDSSYPPASTAAVGGKTADASLKATRIYGSDQDPQAAADRAQIPDGGTPTATPDIPIPASAFRRPIARYRGYVGRQLVQMDEDVATLTAALRRGDRPAAQDAWGAADADYMRVGAAYGSFGTLDERIDGMPSAKPRGVEDPSFSGLHRIEHELWTGRDPRATAAWSVRLRDDVARLRRRVPSIEIEPIDYAIRAHEILEDAQRDLLSGTRLPWSGEGVRATSAALDATVEVIDSLRPVVQANDDAIVQVDGGVARLRETLAAVRREHGGQWPTVAQLSRRQRARLNGALGALLEKLSAVPDAAASVALPQIPTIAAQRARAAQQERAP
jgi:iron uptake system EfeUOB component EfeO/EfeM